MPLICQQWCEFTPYAPVITGKPTAPRQSFHSHKLKSSCLQSMQSLTRPYKHPVKSDFRLFWGMAIQDCHSSACPHVNSASLGLPHCSQASTMPLGSPPMADTSASRRFVSPPNTTVASPGWVCYACQDFRELSFAFIFTFQCTFKM